MTGNAGGERVVGKVVGLFRYPVKSMAPESLQDVDVSWHGVVGDRRWAFVRDGIEQSGFPWLTLRQNPRLHRYRPSFIEPDEPETSRTVVETPAGRTLDVTDPELALDLWPEGARVIRQNRGVFDTFPISLITTQSVRRLGGLVGRSLEVGRFRPNILVDAEDDPFPEEGWVGRVVRLGALRMRIDKRDGRCVVITIDPVTGERHPEVLRTVVEMRDGCLGVYGTTVEPGRISVGDSVAVEGR